MGYSPTEYAEFTEPPAEMSSHGFLLRRVWHLAIPTPPAMSSHRIHRIWQRGYGRDAIPSYICEHPCRLWEALLCQRFCEFRAHLWEVLLSQKFLCVPCVLWEYLFSHGIHRIHRICQRGYGRDAIPSYICAHPCHLWEFFLCKRFCVFGAFRGSFFTACSVGAAETAAPPGSAAWVWQGCHTLLHL